MKRSHSRTDNMNSPSWAHFFRVRQMTLVVQIFFAVAACDPSCKPNTAKRAAQCEELGRAKTWEDWDKAIGCRIARPAEVCAPDLICWGPLAAGEAGQGERMYVDFLGNFPADGGWGVWIGVTHRPDKDRDGDDKCDPMRFALGCYQVCELAANPETGEVTSSEFFDDSNWSTGPQRPSSYTRDGGTVLVEDRAAICAEWK